MDKKGFLVAVYGMNNIGKTSVVEGVIKALANNAFYLKYPVYDTPTGKRLNMYLREGNPEKLSPIEAQKIFAKNRLDFEPELVQMGRGRIGVLEDYNGTGKAWGIITGATIEEMEEINKGQLEPDLNILLDGERFECGIESGHKHEGIGNEAWDKGREIHRVLGKRYNWEKVEVKFGELDREIKEVTNLIKKEIQKKEI